MKRFGKYTLKEKVGSGAYGQVYRAVTSSGEECAVKVIPKSNLTRKLLKYLDGEARILDQLAPLKNENIVRLLDKKESEHNYYMVFEYCNGGDLRTYLREKGGRLSERSARHIILQLINAMNVLYDQGIIHRDLKLGNVLVHYPDEAARDEDRPLVKLADFGFSLSVPNVDPRKTLCDQYLARSIVGTATSMSPETMHQQPYSFKSDIWSMGIVLYELLTGQFCFAGNDRVELLERFQTGLFEIPENVTLSLECVEFLNGCLQYDPSSRLSWEEVMQHPFVADSDDTFTPFVDELFRKVNPTAPKRSKNGGLVLSNKSRFVFCWEVKRPRSNSGTSVNRTRGERQKRMRKLSRKFLNHILKPWAERDREQVRSPSIQKNTPNCPCSPNRKNNRR